MDKSVIWFRFNDSLAERTVSPFCCSHRRLNGRKEEGKLSDENKGLPSKLPADHKTGVGVADTWDHQRINS